MTGAEWVSWVFASMFAALTFFYVVRLLVSARQAPALAGGSAASVDLSRGVMSLGMFAMLVPWLDPLPRLVWQVMFGLAAGFIALRVIGRGVRTTSDPRSHLGGHPQWHLVIGGVAMVYMFAVTPAGHEHAHGMTMPSTGAPDWITAVLTWAFVAYFLVFVVRLSSRLAVPVTTLAPTPARGVVVSPHLLGSSEVVMGIGMSYMLITML